MSVKVGPDTTINLPSPTSPAWAIRPTGGQSLYGGGNHPRLQHSEVAAWSTHDAVCSAGCRACHTQSTGRRCRQQNTAAIWGQPL